MPQDFRATIALLIEREARPVDKYGHQPRLYALTRQIGEGSTYDDDIVYAAAWLHDIGVFIGNRPEDPEELRHWDHVGYACERVPGILDHAGFPREKIPAVLDAIQTHQPHDTPTTIEATILRDADILEQLGAIGILRNVSKVGRDTRFARFSDILPVLKKSLNDLPGKIRLDRTRELAAEKIRLLSAFLEAAEHEAAGNLF
ncbi:HD domain-containing protein [Silvibacterium acidisoli]|uniref:HD domain-containing protein n=1 Tax=Acidobacteriaceae bacterium ZG23-2 TaxID=2883246 RepID=UPI00406D1F06